MRAIQIIHEEHRSLAAVLHGMLFLVREMRYAGAEPNFDVLVAMVHYIDVFSERGFHASVDVHKMDVPERVDLATGQICCRTKKVYRIEIRFPPSDIRRGH